MFQSPHDVLLHLIEYSTDAKRQLSWSEQLNKYLATRRNKYPALKNKDVLVVQPIPQQTINLNEESKYYYDPKLIGDEFNNFIVNFNLVVSAKSKEEIWNTYYWETHNILLDILLIGVLNENIIDDELPGDIISKSMEENNSVHQYVSERIKNIDLMRLTDIIKASYMSMNLANVILSNILGMRENIAWRNDDGSFRPTNLNILTIQLFNRCMYHNFKKLKEFINTEVLNGEREPDIVDMFYINLFKLWLMNTFDISEYVHVHKQSIGSLGLYEQNGLIISCHDNNWGYDTLVDKEMDVYLSKLNEFIIKPNNEDPLYSNLTN